MLYYLNFIYCWTYSQIGFTKLTCENFYEKDSPLFIWTNCQRNLCAVHRLWCMCTYFNLLIQVIEAFFNNHEACNDQACLPFSLFTEATQFLEYSLQLWSKTCFITKLSIYTYNIYLSGCCNMESWYGESPHKLYTNLMN